MTQVIRICKYSCGTQLSEFDKKENKYREVDGTLHTRDRCESLKQGPKGHDVSVDVLLRRLEQLGISIDLGKLRLVQ